MSILSGGGALPYESASPEGLAARWVRWVAGVGPFRNPVRDRSGRFAGLHQPDDVWFLAGTFGGEVRRRCVVPGGRPLFLPAFNIWSVGAEGPPEPVPDAFGHLVVDDVPTEVDVIATPVPFAVAGALLNPVTGTRQAVPVNVWGLWRRLDPLPAGSHSLHVSGGDGYGFTVEVTYRLDVV
ncbi:hypothetical protein [Dactylosporangium sp. NPDC051484]|uniref:hypothetical protein n=1 Tax=Dactylosporangium sp. NPDC051484 TaxID=3154942 RepID=UPI00344E32CC